MSYGEGGGGDFEPPRYCLINVRQRDSRSLLCLFDLQVEVPEQWSAVAAFKTQRGLLASLEVQRSSSSGRVGSLTPE